MIKVSAFVTLGVLLSWPGATVLRAQRARVRGETATVQVDPSGAGAVRGIITAADTNLPLGQVAVELRGVSPASTVAHPATHRAVTGNDGQFGFTGVPSGEYVLSARRPGFGPRIYYPMSGVSSFAVSVRERPPIQMSMVRLPAVEGLIVGPNGSPLAGAKVALSHYREMGAGRQVLVPEREVTADRQGRFQVPGVPDGEYLLSAASRAMPTREKPGLIYAHTFYPGMASVKHAELITVAGGRSVKDLKIPVGVSPAFAIGGRLTDTSGAPLAGVAVLARRYGDDGVPSLLGLLSSVTKTNSNGGFRIAGLPSGKYRVSVETQKWVASRTIELEGADSPHFTLVADVGAAMIGRVVLESNGQNVPASAVRLILQSEDEPGVRGALHAKVNDDGTFEIRGIPEGPARLLATLNSESYYLKAIRLNGDDVVDRAVPLANGQTISGVEVVISLDAAELRGSVASGDSTSEAPASVLLFPAKTDLWQSSPRLIKVASTNLRGDFVIRGIMPGDYKVVAVDKAPAAVDPAMLAALEPSAEKLVLSGRTVGKRVARARVELPRRID